MDKKDLSAQAFRVLLVDDEVLFTETVQDIFAESEAELQLCHKSTEVLAQAKSQQPDLILLDIHFPDADGLQILEALKADPDTWQIPVIMLTADSQKKLIEQAVKMGAVDYLVKPFRIRYFQEKLNQFFGISLFKDTPITPTETLSGDEVNYRHSERILLIDDDKSIQHLVTDIIHELGYPVTGCYNGEEGIEAALKDTYDLILLNINMPTMGGYEVLTTLRKHPETQEIPVILMTGESEREKIEAARELGISGYIIKPFPLRTLISQIQQALH